MNNHDEVNASHSNCLWTLPMEGDLTIWTTPFIITLLHLAHWQVYSQILQLQLPSSLNLVYDITITCQGENDYCQYGEVTAATSYGWKIFVSLSIQRVEFLGGPQKIGMLVCQCVEMSFTSPINELTSNSTNLERILCIQVKFSLCRPINLANHHILVYGRLMDTFIRYQTSTSIRRYPTSIRQPWDEYTILQ